MRALGRRELARAALAAAGAALTGCRGDDATIVLRGAGATLPYPLYARWIERHRDAAPRVRVDYQPVGSAAGVRHLAGGMADLAASDAAVRDLPFDVVQVPVAASAVAVAHRLPVRGTLRLGPRALAAIFAGVARRWSDPVIVRDNPDLALPDLPIVPIHRSDGSGATLRLTTWLARRDALAAPAAPGLLVRFPAGLGARGSEGVASAVARVRGAIGYVEVLHARAAGLAAAAIAHGDADPGTLPDDAAVARAVASAAPADAAGRIEVDDALGYPLTSFTYAIVRRDHDEPLVAGALARFVHWILGPGQDDAAPLGYHPLPDPIAERARALVASGLLVGGRPAVWID